MKVVFLLSGLGSGGLENYLFRFLNYCNRSNLKLQTTIICRGDLNKEDSILSDKFRSLGVKIKYMPMKSFSIIKHFQLANYLRKQQFDTLCDFSGHLSGFVILIAYFLKINTRVASYRESRFQFKSTAAKRMFVAISKVLINFFATKILSNSKDALLFFHPKSQNNKKFKIIDNAINIPQESNFNNNQFRSLHNIPTNAFLIGHVGRFSHAKNHNMIAKFINRINKLDTSVHFVLCGKGVRDGMINLGYELSNVHYIEYSQSLGDFYHSLDFFYFPSLNEGQPNVLLEAMSIGIPFIASNIPSIKEIVPKSAWSFLVDPDDISSCLSIFKNYQNDNLLFPSADVSKYISTKYGSHKNFELFYDELDGSKNDE